MKAIPNFVTPRDFPDWAHAFDGEASYPLTAACWSAWYASTGGAPSANPARALANITGESVERIIAKARGGALVTKDLYNNLKLCQAAHAVGAAEARA